MMKKVMLIPVLVLAAAALMAEGSTEQAGDFTYTALNGEATITGYSGSPEDVMIPATVNELPVTAIGNNAFQFYGLTGVTMPDSVTAIGDYAFYGNQLTDITIPGSVTAIGRQAFTNNQLYGVTIPDSVTSIGAQAFSDNPVTSVTIGAGVSMYGNSGTWPFPDGFVAAYTGGGSGAGTYVSNDGGETWEKE
jgi:hypothetical protein